LLAAITAVQALPKAWRATAENRAKRHLLFDPAPL
jgi:hypothetical protein